MEQQIKRHGNHIRTGKPGVTIVEKQYGNLPGISVRKNGREINNFSGSSLMFSTPLTAEDKRYLSTFI